MKREGAVHKFGDNINTDIISPPQYLEMTIVEASQYAMSPVDPDFAQRCKKGDLVVAGKNFGSGSSRETAPLMLKQLGVGAIVAKFFARIFYRNAINIGLPVIECADTDRITAGDILSIDFEAGIIENRTANETYKCSAIPAHIMEMILEGGMVPYLRKKLQLKSSTVNKK